MNDLPPQNDITNDFKTLKDFLLNCDGLESLELLEKEKIKLKNLPRYSLTDLATCGVPFGPAKNIYDALEKYRSTSKIAPPPPPPPPSPPPPPPPSPPPVQPPKELSLWAQMQIQEMEQIRKRTDENRKCWIDLFTFQKNYREEKHIMAIDFLNMLGLPYSLADYLHSIEMIPSQNTSICEGFLYKNIRTFKEKLEKNEEIPQITPTKTMKEIITEISRENRSFLGKNAILTLYWDNQKNCVNVNAERNYDKSVLADILNRCNMKTVSGDGLSTIDFKTLDLSIRYLMQA